jgi:hypothetical protein
MFLSFGINLAFAEHSPLFTYEELSKVVGYHEIWDAHKSGRISEDEHWALDSYVNYDDPIYPEINRYLRTGETEELYYFESPEALIASILNMDSGITKLATLPDNLMTFRGVTFEFRNKQCYSKGEEFTDKAFVSTSVQFSVAAGFAGINSDSKNGSGILYLYSDTKSHPGILINSLEKEVLLPRGLTFKVMDRVDRKNACHLLVQICSQSCTQEVSKKEIKATFSGLQKLR